jgi:hypothetical protein
LDFRVAITHLFRRFAVDPRNIAQAAFPKLARLRTTNQSPLILAAPAAQPALISAALGLCEIAQRHTRLSS